MTVKIFTDKQFFRDLASEWPELMGESAANHLFLTPAFQQIWWRHFGEGQLRLAALRDDRQKLVALAPMMLNNRTLSLIGGEEVADYLDVIVRRENEEENYRQIWRILLTLDWKELHLTSIPAASPTLRYFPQLAKEVGLAAKIAIKNPVFVLVLPESWGHYLEDLPRHKRHELKRKLRKAEVNGMVETYRTTQAAKIQGDLDVFFKLHRASRAVKAQFMDEKMEKFFREIATVFFSENKLALEILLIGGRPAAAHFSFLWQNQRLLYNSGFDPSLSSLAPGLVLAAYQLRQAIEEKVELFDFMQGGERYKRDLGGQERFVYNIDVFR